MKFYRAGDGIPYSGLYRVIHQGHMHSHEVTCISGEPLSFSSRRKSRIKACFCSCVIDIGYRFFHNHRPEIPALEKIRDRDDCESRLDALGVDESDLPWGLADDAARRRHGPQQHRVRQGRRRQQERGGEHCADDRGSSHLTRSVNGAVST